MTISNKSTKAVLLAEIARLNTQIELMRDDIRTEREVSAAEIQHLKEVNAGLVALTRKVQPQESTPATKPVVPRTQKLLAVRFGNVSTDAHVDVFKVLPDTTEKVVRNVRVKDIPNMLRGVNADAELINLPSGIEISRE